MITTAPAATIPTTAPADMLLPFSEGENNNPPDSTDIADIRGPYTDLNGRLVVPFPAQYKRISKAKSIISQRNGRNSCTHVQNLMIYQPEETSGDFKET
ncbi:hypothetical protein CR513_37090, partial [Mucuna pruriens]